MLFTSSIVAVAMAVLTNSATAAPLEQRATDDGFGLSIAGGRFDFSYLQSYRLFYANDSAYIGQIKYEQYSEPLVVQGANINGAGNGLSFLSIHSSPTGYQNMYVIPHQSQPVGFSVAHGSAPSNARIGNFTFGSGGNLLNNGLNLFYACQNGAEAAINSYQIWWIGNVLPSAVSCIGPISILQSDGCARL